MGTDPIRIALVLLEDRLGRFALQLRSPIEGIANPDHWGIFGGHIEMGESASQGAQREIAEELNSTLDVKKLRAFESFDRGDNLRYFVFHYAVENELDQAQLMEGEDFDYFAPEQILQGQIRGKPVVAHHMDVLQRMLDKPV